MKRVVITGIGIWSSIGQDIQAVAESLKNGHSGVIFDSKRIEYGLQSALVGNVPRPDLKPFLSRRARQMMSSDSEYAYMAARQAFSQAQVSDEYLRNNKVGVIMGNDGNSHLCEYSNIMDDTHCSSLITYNAGFRSVTSSVVINLSSIFHLRGINLCVASGCSSAAYAIKLATMFIRQGVEDVILVGGSADPTKELVACVDATIINSQYNTNPTAASRPFDENAGGVVFSGGAVTVIAAVILLLVIIAATALIGILQHLDHPVDVLFKLLGILIVPVSLIRRASVFKKNIPCFVQNDKCCVDLILTIKMFEVYSVAHRKCQIDPYITFLLSHRHKT